MSTYATLEWFDKGAVYNMLRESYLNIDVDVLGSRYTDKYSVDITTGKFKYKVAIKDSISTELNTSFEPLSSRAGGFVQSGIELFQTAGAATGTLSGLAAYMDWLTWEKTEPMKIQIEALFMTEKNALMDVIVPMKSIESLAVLTKVDNVYKTPGINLSNYGVVTTSSGAMGVSNPNDIKFQLNQADKFKFMSISIPGRVNLDIALVESVTPEYSSHTTDDGSPLWGKLDIRLVSLFPANDEMLSKPLQDIIDRKKNRLERAANPDFAQEVLKKSPLGDIFKGFG